MPSFVQDVQAIRRRAEKKIEEGAVTEAYRGDKDKTVAILNEALATEIVCVLRYQHHYFMATGVHGKSVADEFKEHADSEREHVDMIAERITQLGGKPDFNPRKLMESSATQYVEGETLEEMIREDLIAERIVIEVYNEMIRYFGDNDPTTRRMIEHILQEEEEHAADLSDLLYIVNPQTGDTAGKDPGANPLEIKARRQQQQEQQQRPQQNGERSQRNQPNGGRPQNQQQSRGNERNRAKPPESAGSGRNEQRQRAQREPGTNPPLTPDFYNRDRDNVGNRAETTKQRQSTEEFAGRGSVVSNESTIPSGKGEAGGSRRWFGRKQKKPAA